MSRPRREQTGNLPTAHADANVSRSSTQSGEPVPALEARLKAADERLSRAAKALEPKHKGGELEEYVAARAALLSLERAVASAKGDEYAEPVKFPVRWCTGAPLPHLLANDDRTFLIFLVDRPDPNWDGTTLTVKNPADGRLESLALVEFVGCASVKLGSPNDEVLHGHPLHKKGLEGYTAQVVRNSRWLAELDRINSVHPQYNPDRWRKLNHFIFWFHDTTFECAAESYKVELCDASFADLLARVSQRLSELG